MSSDIVRHFDHHTTWKDVEDMTIDEAVVILLRYANSDGREWSARPHLAKACQMAIEALLKEKEGIHETNNGI